MICCPLSNHQCWSPLALHASPLLVVLLLLPFSSITASCGGAGGYTDCSMLAVPLLAIDHYWSPMWCRTVELWRMLEIWYYRRDNRMQILRTRLIACWTVNFRLRLLALLVLLLILLVSLEALHRVTRDGICMINTTDNKEPQPWFLGASIFSL